MVFQCLNSKCSNPDPQKLFVHPAKIEKVTVGNLSLPRLIMGLLDKEFSSEEFAQKIMESSMKLEIHVCPHCESKNYTEHNSAAEATGHSLVGLDNLEETPFVGCENCQYNRIKPVDYCIDCGSEYGFGGFVAKKLEAQK